MQYLDMTGKADKVAVCGDIHADFVGLSDAIERAGLTHAIVIVAGDCGFGFFPQPYYEEVYLQKMHERLEQADVTLLMIRGNHDGPKYFTHRLIDFARMKTLPDYTVVATARHRILCVGGALSIDRVCRLEDMALQLKYEGHVDPLYWPDEPFVYDEAQLKALENKGLRIDTVVTHTAPAFCEPVEKSGLADWAEVDPNLLADVRRERTDVNRLYQWLCDHGHPLASWFYGHFHYSATTIVGGVQFRLAAIKELIELR